MGASNIRSDLTPVLSAVPEVSVIVVNWNGKHLLHGCFSSLRCQTFRDFEVILVDNGSSDGSVPWVAAHYPEVRIVALETNQGFCGGNNAGIRAARGTYVALLNNDTEVETDWLSELVRHVQGDETIGACDSKILYFDRRDTIWSTGGTYTIAGTANFRGQGRKDTEFAERADVFTAVACSAIYPRRVLDEVGWFDEDFFAGYEDVDWSFRARLRGYRIVNVPSSRVYHKVSATHQYNSPVYVYHGQRNVTAVFVKNMPAALLLRYGGLHLLYALGSLVYFARIGHASAFLKGKRDALRQWRALWRKRREVQHARRAAAAQIDACLSRDWLGPKVRKFQA
jgi:GT2 family glycosyltransferase